MTARCAGGRGYARRGVGRRCASSPAPEVLAAESHPPRNSGACSERGLRAVTLLPQYLADARSVPSYSPDTPEGVLNLSVAENRLVEGALLPQMDRVVAGTPFKASDIYYQPTHGMEDARVAMAQYMTRVLARDMFVFSPDNLILGAGCNAVLENLFFCISEGGSEGVMLPTPYYAAFEFDLVARAGMTILPVNTLPLSLGPDDAIPVDAYYPNRTSLDAAYDAALANGVTPRAILLSHPNNPLGICYPKFVLLDILDWAKSRSVHVVSDEIYAGSVYDEEGGTEWTSVASLLPAGLGDTVHIVYALSKDFGLSGLRVGALYTENEDMKTPLRKLNDMCQISSHTQNIVAGLLGGRGGLDASVRFLNGNNEGIKVRSLRLMNLLDDHNVPYLHGKAGLFLWMDLRAYLPQSDPSALCGAEDDDRRERELYLDLMKKHGLLFTPGRSMRMPMPGFFRCVFTAAGEEEFNLALGRLEGFLGDNNNL